MRHVDRTTLALVALGETAVTRRERRHINACPSCAKHVRERTSIVGRVRGSVGSGALCVPRAEVWLVIRAELGLTPGLLPDHLHTVAERPLRSEQTHGAAQAHREGQPGRAMNRRRWVRGIALALASVVVLGAVVVGMLVWPAVAATRVILTHHVPPDLAQEHPPRSPARVRRMFTASRNPLSIECTSRE